MTGGAPTQPRSWAVHFPGNLRWTNAMQIVKGMAPVSYTHLTLPTIYSV